MKRYLLVILLLGFSSFSLARGICELDKTSESVIDALFSGTENILSLLWWDDPDGKIINARSFVINGHDSIPIFSSEVEAKEQLAGSGYEKDLVSVKPRLLAEILQKMEYTILNPGGKNPIQFKSCYLKKYAEQ